MAQLNNISQRGPSLTAPKTVGAVVRQARDAFRRYRQDTTAAKQQQQQQQQDASPQQPSVQSLQGGTRLTLQLPLPVASMAPPGVQLMDQSFTLFDEGDWPGGIVQRFRALRPLVEGVLEGYDPQFLGMLESPADGVGCWALPDTTLAGIGTNATFASFAKLCEGGYGSRPLAAGHSVVAINPDWTGPADIGQFWERKLKQSAEELLAPEQWQVLYSCRMLRTSRGKAFGLLVGSYGLGWHLWRAGSEESSSVQAGNCLLWSADKPEQSRVIETLNKAAAAAA
ncbi:hypothetical protein OEZ86_007564 [Tetradesmus obliquus]|nr:hypothetical protein OEZ86_007564 [Tetradesmus obliquus]